MKAEFSEAGWPGPVPATAPTSGARVAESVVAGAAGAVLGGVLGGLIAPAVGWSAAVVAGTNGVISGWRRIYSWRRRDGWIAFVLDSTWNSAPIVGSLLAHGIALVRHGDFEASLSTRQNRHVYRGGATLKKGYALTAGNVISGAGDVDRPRRRRLITDHEDVHVWQSRWFGPIYPLVYGMWFVGGSVAGFFLWLRRRPKERLGSLVESCAYYTNPFEWWAYSRDDHWPPSGKALGVGWRKAAVRPLAQLRAEREHR